MSEIDKRKLYFGSCIALIATSVSFAVRGDIMGDFETVFSLTKENVGWISGAAFWGFGLSILFGGPLCDILGLRNIIRLAALGHIGGTLLTIFATNYSMLFAATLIIGIGNGLVEASINPLVATIYSDQKTKKLTQLHAWFPGGVMIGGVLCFALTKAGLGMGSDYGWQIKMLLVMIPAIVYMILMWNLKFPETESSSAGIPLSEMLSECFRRPIFWIIFICMWLTASTELGPGQWMTNIFNDLMPELAGAGILLLVWGNGLMYVLRQFGAGFIHEKFTPVSLIACTAPMAAAGLWLFSVAESPIVWVLASAMLYVGVCFWWPTMLGIASERTPRTGVLGLAIIGAAGSISTAVSGPVMGAINDNFGADRVLPIWASLPVVITIIFAVIYFIDKAKGGYKVEKIDGAASPDEAPGSDL